MSGRPGLHGHNQHGGAQSYGSGAPPQVQYSFPILNSSEILLCMSELQIPVSEDMLKKPNVDSVRRMFEQFLGFLLEVTPEELSQPELHGLEALQYPELHEESVQLIAFHRSMQKLMDASGIPDFSMRDYLYPEFQRLRRLLSGVINFAKFREERLVRFQELAVKSDGIQERKVQLEQENASLKARLETLLRERRAHEPEVNELQESIRTHITEMSHLSSQQAVLQNEIQELKTAVAEISDKLAETKLTLLNELQEKSRLQAQIVQSPDRVRQEIEFMQEQIDEESANVSSVEQRSRALEKRSEALEQCEDELRELLKIMEDCEREMERLKNIQKETKEQRSRILEQENERHALDLSEAHIARQISSIEDRVVKVQQQARERRTGAKTMLQQLRVDLDEAARDKRGMAEKAEANWQVTQETQIKIRELKESHIENVTALTNKYHTLEQSVLRYHKQLFHAMERATNHQTKGQQEHQFL
ncbi:putative kinetochore protein nuf2 [Porphyridium purpureum]|uniref:Putative kinetochore protein nuf2 n=1 Tax=Porphyridium purpureum TaxID=35688 RepID=A0A5J4YVZ5_PORPP|nr:putative kinetochore protein nuf2 [Porphyridium purpureum]|eukprot:POR2311..scf209_3